MKPIAEPYIPPAATELDSSSAYALTLRELEPLPTSPLLPINLDVTTITTTVLGALSSLRQLQPELEAELADFDPSAFDRLRRYAFALQQAHAIYSSTSPKPTEKVTPLVEELTQIRGRFQRVAKSLVAWNQLDAQQLKRIGKHRGHLGLVGDVLALVAVFRERWSSIGNTPLTLTQLDRAEALSMQLLTALGRRSKPPAAFQDAVRVRQQIFTLLVRTYEKVRKAVRYVRWWHRDEELFAPSLYRRRTGKARAVVARPRKAAGKAELSGVRAPEVSRTPERALAAPSPTFQRPSHSAGTERPRRLQRRATASTRFATARRPRVSSGARFPRQWGAISVQVATTGAQIWKMKCSPSQTTTTRSRARAWSYSPEPMKTSSAGE